MLAKECKTVFRQSLAFVVSALVLIVLVWLVSPAGGTRPAAEYLFLVGQFFLLFCALFFGLTLFAEEHRQNGLEYMLSLPYSRPRLLLIKLLPRLAALAVFWAAYVLLVHGGWAEYVVIPLPFFTVLCVVFFLVAAAAAMVSANLVTAAVTALGAVAVYFLLLGSVWLAAAVWRGGPELFGLSGWSILTQFPRLFRHVLLFPDDYSPSGLTILPPLLLALPFPWAMFTAFRRFEPARPRRTIRHLAVFLLPALAAAALLSVLAAGLGIRQEEYTHYTLTADRRLVRMEMQHITVYTPRHSLSLRIPAGLVAPWMSGESGDSLYFTALRLDRSGDALLRVRPGRAEAEFLFSVPGERLAPAAFFPSGRIAVWGTARPGPRHGNLHLLSAAGRSISRTTVPADLLPAPALYSEESPRAATLWMYSRRVAGGGTIRLLRIDTAEGVHEAAVLTDYPFRVAQRLFLPMADGLHICRVQAGELVTERIVSERCKRVVRVAKATWESPLPEILLWRGDRLAALDPAAGTLRPLDADFALPSAEILGVAPHRLVVPQGDAMGIYEWRDGRMHLLGRLPRPVATDDNCFFADGGVVVLKNGRVNVHSLPEFQPLEYAGLH